MIRQLWLLRNRFAAHLMHRRCRFCYEKGRADGFYEAARAAKERERIWREVGVDPALLEQYIRRAA